MVLIFIRTIIIYIFVLIVMRTMGKRQIGQIQPFELVIAMMIADLAAVPMAELGIPISNGIIPILGLLVMYMLISILNMKSVNFRKIMSGKPAILIYRGKINEESLRKESITINELLAGERAEAKTIKAIAEENIITAFEEREKNKD